MFLYPSARVETEIVTLAVDPLCRRRGIARRLTEQFVAWTVASGADAAHLEVASNNEAALALYRQAGFTKSGCRKNYYWHSDQKGRGRQIDAVCMTLSF